MKTAVLLVIESDGDTIMASIRGHFERCGGTIVNHLVIQQLRAACGSIFQAYDDLREDRLKSEESLEGPLAVI